MLALSLWFHRQLPIVLTQKPYRYQRKNVTKKVRQKPHTIIIHYSLAVLAPPFVFPCVA